MDYYFNDNNNMSNIRKYIYDENKIKIILTTFLKFIYLVYYWWNREGEKL